MKKVLTYSFAILFFTLVNFVNAPKANAACITGPFNAQGRDGCEGLLLMTDSNVSLAASFKYIRFFGGGGYYDTFNIDNKISTIPNNTYFVPFNEPDLEGWTPEQASEILNHWNNNLHPSIVIVIPPYSHNEGSVKQSSIDAVEALIESIPISQRNKRQFVLGANVYGGLKDPIAGASDVIQGHLNVINKYDFIKGLVITELGLIAHPCVDEGGLTLDQWMAGTAGLMRSMYGLEKSPSTGKALSNIIPGGTVSFSGFLSGQGYQVPLFYAGPDNIYYQDPSSRAQKNVDIALATQIMNGSLGSIDTANCAYKGNIFEYSCQDPEPLSADTSCVDCSGNSQVEDKSSWFQKLVGAVAGIIRADTDLLKRVAVSDFRGAHTDFRDPKNGLLFTKTENEAYYFVQNGMDTLNGIAKETNGDKPPVIDNLAKIFPPGKELITNAAVYKQANENSTRVEITISNQDPIPAKYSEYAAEQDTPIQIADNSGVMFVNNINCTMANSIWSNPENILCFNAPFHYTKEEAFGTVAAKKHTEYLAQINTEFKANNYSQQDINKMVAENAKERSRQNTIKYLGYDPTKQVNNTITLAANKQTLYQVEACILPVPVRVPEVCRNLREGGTEFDIQKNTTVVYQSGSTDCKREVDETGNITENCGSDSHTFDAFVARGGYLGNEIWSPSGIAEPCIGTCALQQNSAQYVAQNDSKIQLTSTGSYRGGYNTPGTVALQHTFWYMLATPDELANKDLVPATEMSSKVPIELESTTLGLTGIGSFNSTSDEVITGAGFAKKCSLPRVASISIVPGSNDEKIMNRIVDNCKIEPQFATPSYCGTLSGRITNKSANFVIADKDNNILNPVDDPQTNNPYYFLDNDSDIVFKLANRFVDGASVILNGIVLPNNPGNPAASCGSLESGASTNISALFEIRYLPLNYSNNPNNESSWKEASKLTPLQGATNLELDLRVKPGYYRIYTYSTPCSMGGVAVLSGATRPELLNGVGVSNTGTFKLGDPTNTNTTKNKEFCAKLTRNPSMRGGGWNDERDRPTNVNGCAVTLDGTGYYDALLNNACGGLTGKCEDCDKWKNILANAPSENKELYKNIFGEYPDAPGSEYSCGDVFPSTLFETDCNLANNRDIMAVQPTNEKDNSIEIANGELNPPWESKTPNLEKGIATYYGRGIMQTVLRNRLAWNDITPADIANCRKIKGSDCEYVAMMRKGDMGRIVYMKARAIGGAEVIEGPFLVIDMGATHDIPDLVKKKFVIDLQYEIAQRLGMVGVGPVPAVVCDTKKQCEEVKLD